MSIIESRARWDAAAGKRYRILVTDSGSKIPIIWFRLAKDGSVYLGPYLKHCGLAKYGETKDEGDGPLISYKNGEEIDISEMANPAKISLHASGSCSRVRSSCV